MKNSTDVGSGSAGASAADPRKADDTDGSGGRMPSAVVIDADDAARSAISALPTESGFDVITTGDGVDGIRLVREHHPHLTTIALELPGIDGIETVRRARAVSASYIVLVAPSFHESDAILALGSGADDYVTLPLRPLEFRARVRAMLSRPRTTGILLHRDLALDSVARAVRRRGIDIALTRTEFDLLETLLESGRRPRSKADLARVARGDDPAAAIATAQDERVIEVHVTNLRRKLGDDASRPTYIETVRGLGYRLTPSPDGAAPQAFLN
jgi:two-component system OmpR family response regulator